MKINIQEIVKELQSLITHKILIGNDILDEYHHDEMNTLVAKPDLVVKPISTEEVSSIMKVASKYNIPVLARGSGTGLVGGAVAINGGIVIDMRLMNKIIELDENNLTIRVQPGVLLLELSQYVESKNFFYPPDPGEKTATIGGNISTNAGGMRAVKYGVTRPYVRALTVVLASGEILKLGSKTVKNSSGYDLLDLMIGSEGTLGVITEATLRLIPLPLYTLSLLVPYKDMPTALNTVGKLLRFKVLPVAIEFMTRQTLIYVEEFLNKKFPDTKHEAYLLLTFDANNEQTLNYEYTEAADLCLENGAIDVLLVNNDDRKKTVWTSRGAFLEAIKSSTTKMDECDVVVPRDQMADFLLFSDSLQNKYDIRIVSFGHAGDGNLHIYICKDNLTDEQFDDKLSKVFNDLYDRAAKIGGLVSGEHGIGYAKKSYLKKQFGPLTMSLMKNIKKVFDPQNILNPEKICE